MYLEIFLADFAVFRVFLGISRNFAGPRPREISEALIKKCLGVVMYHNNSGLGVRVGLLNKVVQKGSTLRSNPLPFYTPVW